MKASIISKYGQTIFRSDKSETVRDAVLEAVKAGVKLDFADLRNVDLSGIDISNASFVSADLSGANLSNSKIKKSDFTCSTLINTNFSDANLSDSTLTHANASYASFCGANLSYSNLASIELPQASLVNCIFINANLYNANLKRAQLEGSSFQMANLAYARLFRANLLNVLFSSTNIQNADFGEAKNIPYIPMACPSDGAFIGWKKIKNNGRVFIAKLEIPADAKRCSATTTKCRCDKAKVLEIIRLMTNEKVEKVINTSFTDTEYKVGEFVYPDSFDEDRWNECSHGIHFFINKEDAIKY